MTDMGLKFLEQAEVQSDRRLNIPNMTEDWLKANSGDTFWWHITEDKDSKYIVLSDNSLRELPYSEVANTQIYDGILTTIPNKIVQIQEISNGDHLYFLISDSERKSNTQARSVFVLTFDQINRHFCFEQKAYSDNADSILSYLPNI